MATGKHWTIGELARELGVSTRSIRFYEEKGLISPTRSNGNYRLYGKRERARVKLILRGKRFGLSLEECADILGLASVDMDESAQIKKALEYGHRLLTDLDKRLADLKAMRREMVENEKRLVARLAELERGKS